jgi:transposase
VRGATARTSDPGYCRACLAKQQIIDRQTEEIARLKDRLRRQERTAKETPFGAATPSSKRLVKASSTAEARAKRGGAVPGHEGHGRVAATEADADTVETLAAYDVCPCCGGPLEERGERDRTIYDCEPVRRRTRLLRIPGRYCGRCRKTFRPRPAGVLPRCSCSNRLLAQAAVWHYVDGLTLGHIARQFAVPPGTLMGRLHALADRLAPAVDALVLEYRAAPVKHADETGWRCDGKNGYTWGFFTASLSLFRCRQTRSGDVVDEVFGPPTGHLGTLIVDRYAAYNRFQAPIQYCYAHLDRDVDKLPVDNPSDAECAVFASTFSPLLCQAMELRNAQPDDRRFLLEASALKAQIEAVVARPARHPSVQHIQNIFREESHRLYHWAACRDIPAENNRAERELRPLVIARKTSFGSQSEQGLHTREVLMSLLNTLAKRTDDVVDAFVQALDALAEDPTRDVARLLFGPHGIAPPSA